MRELVRDYLQGSISRRTFISRMNLAGFSAMAASSVVQTLQPLSAAHAATGGDALRTFSGRVGEMLAPVRRGMGGNRL